MSNEKVKNSALPTATPESGDFITGTKVNEDGSYTSSKFPFSSFASSTTQQTVAPVDGDLDIDASTGTDFFCVVTENITLNLPSNLINGKTYTIVFEQEGNTATVTFGANVNDVNGEWSMVTGDGNFAIAQFYCTYDRLYMINFLYIT